ncbi:MAG TPA: DNA polymerase III subunit delta' C-terminal domain-containing protein [Buchnera sp. (in: enterobacteria)]|nr:DNA polymerase III subunit delta' C-terminal domain-containing protein [Buchnera sp. (in: enterobacteria)]
MQWYPWLTKTYKKIIWKYQKGTAHHAILLKTHRGIGVLNLFLAITRWLLCTNRKDIKSCGICHSCNLIKSNNHPDWYLIKTKNKNTFLSIDTIRNLIQKIFYTSQQGGAKVIWLPEISLMTESAMCALLKTLEEPPKNTWFFLVNYDNFSIPATLLSRCLQYSLYSPKEKDSIHWLKSIIYKNKILCLTALRITAGSPITAKKLITGSLWLDRKTFFIKLHYAIKNYDLFFLLPFFKKTTVSIILYIDWICILLLDAIKWKYRLCTSLINLDQLSLIKHLSSNYPVIFLHESIYLWMKCKKQLLNIIGINSELLLVERLLTWEENIIFYNNNTF